jgi:hypothetical protein
MDMTFDPDGDSRIREHIRFYSTQDPEAVDRRLRALDGETSLERAVTLGLSGMGAFGLVAGFFGSRLLRLLPWAGLPLLFLYALGRWSPPSAVGEALGLRGRRSIEEERYALKALRGDFKDVSVPDARATEAMGRKAEEVLDAVKK